MVVFDTSLQNIKTQKNRTFSISKKSKLKFGDYGFSVKNEIKFDLIQLSFIKKCFKKLKLKKSKNKNIIRCAKIWMFILPNSVFSKKSKNSRMGKGKGAFERWMFKVRQGYMLSEFLGVPPYRLKKIIFYLNKKLKIKLQLISKINYNFKNWAKSNDSFEFFNKYRYL